MKHAALLLVALLASQFALGQEIYRDTDSEKLSDRIDTLGEQIKEKGQDWMQGTKEFVLGASDIEKALKNLERDPGNLDLHILYFKAAAAKAAELRPSLLKLLENKNPQGDMQKMTAALDEIIALNKTAAERWKMLGGKSLTDSLRDRYLKMAGSAERAARGYEKIQGEYATLDLDKAIGVFRAELEFLNEFESYCQDMIVNLKITKEVGVAFEEAKNISAALTQLADSLEKFSKILSGQYEEEGNEDKDKA